jgi:hypothetical protein
MYDRYLDASAFVGKTITDIKQVAGDRIQFCTNDGKNFAMFHIQDCCESVRIHDIEGDLQSLVGSPITAASEESQSERPEDVPRSEYEDESNTWTTYNFATENAKVRIRWHGSSNGYYSESVQIEEMK